MARMGSGARLSFAGAVAVGTTLATGELLAGLLAGVPSPLLSVARFFVDIQPPGAKELVVGLFGTADKVAFQILIIVVALVVGALVGRLGARHSDVAATIIAVFVGAGFLASMRDPGASVALAAAAAAAQAAVGITVLRKMVEIAQREAAPEPAHGGRRATVANTGGMPDWRRRSLLQAGGALAIGSFVVSAFGRYLLSGQQTPTAEEGGLPTAPKPAGLAPGTDIATADLTAAGLTPIVMPNDRFYRIDTAFVLPTVDRASWTLKVRGMVDREVTLTYDQLTALPIVEQYVTIACVSNEVGGDLVGNAKWTGVALRDVLAMAGVQSGADQLVGRSVDGFTAGMPVEWVMDQSRVPMIAVAMNGEPLPRAHGYPARLIVPGLYGYVSATKWLAELELTTFDAYQAFWVPRGWAQKAPILTQSRIDVPKEGVRVPAGKVAVAGVAWAPDRGIKAVEVRVDQGDWQAATISPAISSATWVQWLYPWDATQGNHTLEVRATDGTGEVQTDQQTPPAPDGARGHHTIGVSVG
jgi:DMSO/TMAO reductase YedYZ molybdopterin-dependent catalytic subunit